VSKYLGSQNREGQGEVLLDGQWPGRTVAGRELIIIGVATGPRSSPASPAYDHGPVMWTSVVDAPQIVVAVGMQVVRGDEAHLRCKPSRHSFHAPPGKGVKPPSGAASPTGAWALGSSAKKLAKSLM